MALNTLSVKAATLAEITAAAAAFPAANRFAALIVEDATEAGTHADAFPDTPPPAIRPKTPDRTESVASPASCAPSPADSKRFLPASRVAGPPPCRSCPPGRRGPSGTRYLSGSRLNSWSRRGCRSRQQSSGSTASGSGISATCLSRAPLGGTVLAFSAVRQATPWSQLATISRGTMDAGLSDEDQKRRLERILGVVVIAENTATDAQDHRPMPPHEDCKGGFVLPVRKDSNSCPLVNPAPSRRSTVLRSWLMTGFIRVVAMSFAPWLASLGLYLYLPRRGPFHPLFLSALPGLIRRTHVTLPISPIGMVRRSPRPRGVTGPPPQPPPLL